MINPYELWICVYDQYEFALWEDLLASSLDFV